SSMTVNVLVEASTSSGGPFSPADTFFGTPSTHRQGTGSSDVDRSHVDVAFYVSTCGDSTADTNFSAEQCDQGGANGSTASCCTSTCQFRAVSSVCRSSAGVCDQPETCTGSAATCPGDVFLPTSTVCRSSAGACDVAENCTGSANCPADAKVASGTVCR